MLLSVAISANYATIPAMSQLESAATADAPPPDDLVEAGCYATARAGFDHGLVVLATGNSYWLMPTAESGHRLLVEPAALAHVRDQLARYDRESAHWPPAPLADASRAPVDFLGPLLWMIAVVALFRLQLASPALTAAGALDAVAVFDRGEIGRAFTSLWLHGNGEHLLSNALAGLFLFSALGSTLGRLRGWLLLVVAAVGANLASAALHYPGDYRSLGASTAIFAALGLLTGRALAVVQRARARRWQAMLLPLGSGLTVLALYGAGGAEAVRHVDIGAHTLGFAAGLILGFVFGAPRAG
jgi:rhomboid protease GluP